MQWPGHKDTCAFSHSSAVSIPHCSPALKSVSFVVGCLPRLLTAFLLTNHTIQLDNWLCASFTPYFSSTRPAYLCHVVH